MSDTNCITAYPDHPPKGFIPPQPKRETSPYLRFEPDQPVKFFIASPPSQREMEWEGRKFTRYQMNVLDTSDGKIKVVNLPASVMRKIYDLSVNLVGGDQIIDGDAAVTITRTHKHVTGFGSRFPSYEVAAEIKQPAFVCRG